MILRLGSGFDYINMKRIVIFLSVFILTIGTAFGISYKVGFFTSPPKKLAANIHMVSLVGKKADPEIVLARVGDYVQFNSRDGKNHDLEQGSGNAIDESHDHKEFALGSGNFTKDEAYKVQFKKVGIYAFHDHYNPDIYIRVIVDDKKDKTARTVMNNR